jgi:hypothetical protein
MIFFVDFISSDHVIVVNWAIVLFHEIWWEGWLGFGLWQD